MALPPRRKGSTRRKTGAFLSDSTPPTAPTNLSASESGGVITLTWTAATDAVGVVGYEILQGPEMRVFKRVGAVTSTTFSLPPGTSRDIYVRAFDAAGNRGAAALVIASAAAGEAPPGLGLPDVLTANIIPRTNTRTNLIALAGNNGEIASSPTNGKLVLFNGNAGEGMEFDSVTWKTVKDTYTGAEVTNLAVNLTTDQMSVPRAQILLQPYVDAVPSDNMISVLLPASMPDTDMYIRFIKPTTVDFQIEIAAADSSSDFSISCFSADAGNNPIIHVRNRKPIGVTWEGAQKGGDSGTYNKYESGANSFAHGDGSMATNSNAVAIGSFAAASGTNGLALAGGKAIGNNVISIGSGNVSTSGASIGVNGKSAGGMALGSSAQSGGAIYEVSSVSTTTVLFSSTLGDFRGRVPATGSVSFRYVPTISTKYKAATYSGTVSSWSFSTSITLTLTAAITGLPTDYAVHGKLYLVVTGGAGLALGSFSDAPVAGQAALSGVSFDAAINGTLQVTKTFLYRASTATTAIELTTSGVAATAGTVAASNAAQIIPGSNNRFVVPSNKLVDLRITILGKHAGATANCAKWVYRATAVNNNGTVTLVDGPTLENSYVASGMGAPVISITAAACAVQVSVTPGNATSSRWAAIIESSELGF